MRGTVVMALCLLLVSGAAGALSLTEGGAVERAVRENLTLASRRAQAEGKRIAADEAWNGYLPGLSLSVGLSRSNQEIPSAGTPYHLNASAQVGASISLSAASLQAVETARLDYQAGRIGVEQASQAVSLQVRKGFYQLILFEKQLSVTRASITTAEQTLEQVRSDYANGRVQQLVLRQAELSVQRAKLTLERQLVQRENARASFKQLLNLPEETAIEIDGTIEIKPVAVDQVAARAALADRPDLRSIAAQIALQESRNRAAYLAMVSPTVTVSAAVAPSFPDPFTPGNPPGSGWNDRGSISLSLSSSSLLALLPFAPQRVNLKVLDTTVASLRLQQEETASAAKTEVASLVRSLAASAAAIDSLRASVNLAQESYDLTREAYGLGTADFLSLKSAEDDLLKAQYDLLSEEYTYLTTVISLEYATGLDLRGRKE